ARQEPGRPSFGSTLKGDDERPRLVDPDVRQAGAVMVLLEECQEILAGLLVPARRLRTMLNPLGEDELPHHRFAFDRLGHLLPLARTFCHDQPTFLLGTCQKSVW